MKQTVNKYDFTEAFRQAGRQDQFSYTGLCALFDYLEEYEEAAGTELELDVIALCCDYSEYATATEAAKEYGWEAPEIDPDTDPEDATEETEAAALEWLQDNTQVITHDSGVIIQSF
jgi:hypothetical protein